MTSLLQKVFIGAATLFLGSVGFLLSVLSTLSIAIFPSPSPKYRPNDPIVCRGRSLSRTPSESSSIETPPDSPTAAAQIPLEQPLVTPNPSLSSENSTLSSQQESSVSSRSKFKRTRSFLVPGIAKASNNPAKLSSKCLEKKPSIPAVRTRTHPYEAPYFIPPPDSFQPRGKPVRSRTMPPSAGSSQSPEEPWLSTTRRIVSR
ncbi:hypothetical protein C8J56DRAFT_1041614 [Mycena floridula]|nr:hypothetical protein C8J56DRAFT_1041614 [Mycena floridula]